MDTCVGLILTNPMQLEWVQMDVVCERYHVLSIFPNKKNFVDCTVRTVLMWQLIIHSIRPYNAYMKVMSWHADWARYVADKWANQLLTDVIFFGKWNGATWPSRGLPCGTPLLDKIVLPAGVGTPDLRGGHVNDLEGSGYHPTITMFLNRIRCKINLNWNVPIIGGGKGSGLSPNPRSIWQCIRPLPINLWCPYRPFQWCLSHGSAPVTWNLPYNNTFAQRS